MRPIGIKRKRPIDWQFVKRALATRRQRRALTVEGYIEADPTECGFTLFDNLRQRGHRIADVQVSTSGTRLFIKTEPAPTDEQPS